MPLCRIVTILLPAGARLEDMAGRAHRRESGGLCQLVTIIRPATVSALEGLVPRAHLRNAPGQITGSAVACLGIPLALNLLYLHLSHLSTLW